MGGAVRWGVVGTGRIAKAFAEDLVRVRKVGVAAVLSRDGGRAKAFVGAVGVPSAACFVDDGAGGFEAFLAACDVVYIATPHTRHVPDALRCLEGGRPVLVEKPLAICAADAVAVVEVAARRGLFCMEALWTRFVPAYKGAVQEVASGAVGRVRSVAVEHSFDGAAEGAPGRLTDAALGGGAWLDLGSYVLSTATACLPPGGEAVPRVAVAAARPHRLGATCDGGTSGTLSFGCGPAGGPGGVTCTFTVQCDAASGNNTAALVGDAGTLLIHAPYHHPHTYSVLTSAGEPRTCRMPVEGNGLWYQTVEVEACLAAGKLQSAAVPWADSVAWATGLESVAASAAGIALAPALPQAVAPEARLVPMHQGQVDGDLARLRVCVLGCRIGKYHAGTLRALGVGEVVECDIGDKPPGKGEVDAFVVSSPATAHREHLRLAAAAAVPAFCEKPLCDTLEETVACAMECAAAGMRVQLGFQRRFDPALRAAVERVRDVAPLHTAIITSRDPAPPPAEYLATMGSHFADMTIHDFDEARWVLKHGGAGEPMAVSATLDEGKERAVAVLRCKGGALCTILNDRSCALGYDQRLEVFGEGGRSAHVELPASKDHFFTERYSAAYAAGMEAFLRDVVLGGKAPEVGVEDGLRAAFLAEAAEKSAAARGAEVPVQTLDLNV